MAHCRRAGIRAIGPLLRVNPLGCAARWSPNDPFRDLVTDKGEKAESGGKVKSANLPCRPEVNG
jgi:hypothetical protein